MRKLTQEEFIERARLIHGDKYDYSKVEYKGYNVKVCIICPIHGEFLMTPHGLLDGYGCRRCYNERQKSLVCGVGLNDSVIPVYGDKSYNLWKCMIKRCYDGAERYSAYKDCSVCDEWLIFSNFKEWYDANYIEGYALDKDILFKDNRTYSPQTCCFVPKRINSLILRNKKHRGYLPIGVYYSGYSYSYTLAKRDAQESRSGYSTPEAAFQAYKTAKEAYIKEVAQEYYNRGEITKKVYDALMRYEVEITD